MLRSPAARYAQVSDTQDKPKRWHAKEGLRTKTLPTPRTDHPSHYSLKTKAGYPRTPPLATGPGHQLPPASTATSGNPTVPCWARSSATASADTSLGAGAGTPAVTGSVRASSSSVPGTVLATIRPPALPIALPHKRAGPGDPVHGHGRKDAPPANATLRGNKRVSLEVARNPDLMSKAMDQYTAEWYSTNDTSSSNWNTWQEFHRAYWDHHGFPDEPVLPLTPQKIHIVGALFKVGRYRTTKNYLNISKTRHVESGGKWSEELELAARRFVQSTLRGIGPGRQSQPLNFELMTTMDFGDGPLVEGGPIGTESLITMFTFFMVRELEGALAARRDIHINTVTSTVTWHLPVSKTDPAALGCERTWGCTCTLPDKPHRSCAYHAALRQLALLDKKFGNNPDMPLFPTVDGKVVDPQRMVELVDAIAELCGETVLDEHGNRRFGKHSWRTSGAVFLTSLGLDTYKVQLLARWASPLVVHYCKLAPLRALTSEFKAAANRQLKSSDGAGSKSVDDKLLKMIDEKVVRHLKNAMDLYSAAHKQEVARLDALIKKCELAAHNFARPRRYVINRKSKVTHRILAGFDEVGVDAITKCGWRYAKAKIEVTAHEPTDHKLTCDTCMPALRALLALS